MRIWDKIEPNRLCKKHLLAEHRETLCIWSVITNNKKGYSKHPETLRFKDNLGSLIYRHNKIITEATKRGYNFKLLPNQDNYNIDSKIIESWDNQELSLSLKQCECIKEINKQ